MAFKIKGGVIHTDKIEKQDTMNPFLINPISISLNFMTLFIKNSSKAFILMNFIDEKNSFTAFVLLSFAFITFLYTYHPTFPMNKLTKKVQNMTPNPEKNETPMYRYIMIKETIIYRGIKKQDIR